jgi:hypothetical protein
MTVEPLLPDTATLPATRNAGGGGFLAALDAVSGVFEGADRAEAAFVAGQGGLQEMIVSRAHADVALAIAVAAAQRASGALTQILGLQI